MSTPYGVSLSVSFVCVKYWRVAAIISLLLSLFC